MAATGGGKIRTRRHHIASKPYAKGKQQAGLISRVTDTVKSIVPSWLQKYFRNGEVVEGGSAAAATRLAPELNSQDPPPNGNEESSPLPDGRDTPEPSTSYTEPSTSRASLNFQDALSRPPLNRTHLHFASLDGSPALGGSSSLFPQPSTSSAAPFGSPFAGASTSNFSLVKEIKDSSSQHEDDNISTTSGFSSRASDKDVPTSKPAPLLWSPETDRTHSGTQASQAGLKKPAFNLSVFGTSALSTMNSSVLNSSQLGDSPYYPGKTTYGGAAANRGARSRPSTPYQVPVRRQIKAKPAGAQPCGVTSATARRILQSLERMSSPLADAKRIPSTISSPLSTSLDRTDLDGSPFQVKKKKMDPSLPPVQKLVVPSAATVSGNRSMAFRPSLTPGGVNRALERTAHRDTPVRSPLIPDATPTTSQSTTSLAYPLSSTPAVSSAGSGGGKMKRERAVRPSTKRPEDEVAKVPDLPAISLPICTRPLPTFSFSPATTTTTPIPATTKSALAPLETLTKKDPPAPSSPPSVPFTFASPIVKATAASPPSFSPSSGFTFSAPVMKTGLAMSNDAAAASSITLAVKSTANAETKEEFSGPFKPAKTLKQGSVLDLLKSPGFTSSPSTSNPSSQPAPSLPLSGFGEKFKPAAGSWTCNTCLLQNSASDTKCVACQTSKPQTDSSSSSSSSSFSSKLDNKPPVAASRASATTGLAAMFAPPAGTWECDTCLVQNKPDALKCVACDTAKPGTGVKPGLTLPALSDSSKSSAAASAPGFFAAASTAASGTAASAATTTTSSSSTSGGLLGFGDKFKKPEGSWDCDTCMVQNKGQDTKCVACQTAKPGASAAAPASLPPLSSSSGSAAPLLGFGDKFKKAAGSWECDVCCVQNKAEDLQCVACQSNKPGAKPEPKATFGSSTSSGSSAGGFKFGSITTPAASSGIKFGGTFSDSPSASPASGFKFGGAASDSNGGFKFGGATSDATGGFKFGSATDSSSSSGGFKFGSSSTTTTEASSTTSGASSGGLTFGSSLASSSTSTTTTTTTSEDSKKTDAASLGGGFKFGASSNLTFGTTSTAPATEASSTPAPAPAPSAESSAPAFSFGVSKPEEKPGVNPGFSFSTLQDAPATSASSTSLPIFGKLPAAEPATSAPSLLSTAKLAEPASKEPGLSAPVFSFGKTEEKKDASSTLAPATSFLFSGGKEAEKVPSTTAASTVGFSFGKPEAAVEAKSVFGFGKPAEKSEAEAPKPTFSFGQSSTDASAAKPAFGFMAAASSSAPSRATPSPSLFDSALISVSDQASAPAAAPAPAPASAPSSTFMFGQSTASDATPAKTFVFGQQAQETPAAPLATPAQPFMFGASANPAAPSFAFGGATSSTPASAAPSPFSFNAATSSTGFGTTQSSMFGQGAAQPAAPAFGSATPSFSAGSQPPAFGAKPPAAPVFGQATNATPAFGSSNTATGQGGGFQFGGAGGFGPSASSSSGVFTFGSAQSPAAPAAQQPVAPGGGFAFGVSPSFNIGSNNKSAGTPSGAQHGIAGRKIKTAVRRRK